MHVANEFDDLDDDDLISAAVHCGNGATKNTLDLSPRPNKRRRVHQDTSTINTSLVRSQSTLKAIQHSPIVARDGVQNGANGNVYGDAALNRRVPTATRVVGHKNNGNGHIRNEFGTRNFGKPTNASTKAIIT